MKTRIRLVLFAATVVMLTGCKKYGSEFDTYFFTDVENAGGPLTLLIDGENRGELPNLKTSVTPTNDTVIKNGLHLKLNAGKYKIEARDSQGNPRCSGTIKFTTNSLRTSVTMGGQATASSGKTIVTKLYY